MHVQVNFVTRRRKGGVSKKSQLLDTTVINIGRGTDQDIFLADIRVAYEHAKIFQGPDGFWYIASKALSGIRINQKPAGTERLFSGDCIEVGSYEIRIQGTTEAFDLVVDVEQVQTEYHADNQLQDLANIDLENNTRLSKRIWSWFFFISILLVFLVVPIVSSFSEPVKKVLDAVPGLPSDTVWNSGKLASVHHSFKEDCKACHQKPFVRVKDEACANCHENTRQHADASFEIIAQLGKTRCASCHEEHNDSKHIIVKNDSLCTDCHKGLKETVEGKTELLDASDFGRDHPEFRPSIPSIDNGKEKLTRISLSEKSAVKEQFNLVFDHKIHLKPKGIDKIYSSRDDSPVSGGKDKINLGTARTREGDKAKLNCDSCHIPDSGGIRMQPISFERFCSDCHQLNFEITDRKRVLPHGKISEVLFYLEEYYKSRALEGGFQDLAAPEVVRRRRRPGKILTRQEKQIALNWAEKKINQVANEVFKYRACKTCHNVTYTGEDSPPWTISPVRIPQRWIPLADFNHASHLTMKCGSCHKAKESEEGADVLLPGIEVCRDCHRGADETKRLASTCIDCHGFHVGKEFLN